MPVDSRPPMPEVSEAVIAELLFRYAGIRVSRWRCLIREAGTSAVVYHKWHIIKFVHTGAFHAHLHDGTVHVDSTRTILAAPRQPCSVTRQYGPEVSGTAIALSPTTMELLGGRGEFDTQLLREEVTPRALLMQHLILRKIEENAPPPVIAELVLVLAADAFRDPSPLPAEKRKRAIRRPDAVSTAQAILAANYEKPVRLDDIARAVGLSAYHLCREFKRVTGMPMRQYLNRLRLHASLEHVADPRFSLTTIALECGFSSHSHFAAAFRNEFRLTPSQARRLGMRNVSELRRTLGFGPNAQFPDSHVKD
jgi:AraC-like DNA-binding protein